MQRAWAQDLKQSSRPRLWCVAAVVFLAVAGCTSGDDARGCAELRVHVADLDGVHLANEISHSEPAWLVVLTTDLHDVTPDHRLEIANAIAEDQKGFDALRAELRSEHHDALDRLHAVGSDSAATLDAGWNDARIELAQYGTQECGLA